MDANGLSICNRICNSGKYSNQKKKDHLNYYKELLNRYFQTFVIKKANFFIGAIKFRSGRFISDTRKL